MQRVNAGVKVKDTVVLCSKTWTSDDCSYASLRVPKKKRYLEGADRCADRCAKMRD